MTDLLSWLSSLALPLMVGVVILHALAKGVDVYDLFVEGAREGLETLIRVAPCLLAVVLAVSMVRGSGLLEAAIGGMGPLAESLGVPPSVLPMALIRPLSGSASLAYLTDLMAIEGPDSLAGLIGATLQGSSDTTLYILAVYFGSVGVRQIRHSVIAGLMADLAGFVGAILACRAVFR